ncbi:MAG TPA: phenylalanine--tRNA ligase beta subunit-related protein [Ktedonobacterales bacterium]|nr:phenylalanine--tRNA ligase beta subunit-related protein [Ktedonobacterales bacterium]
MTTFRYSPEIVTRYPHVVGGVILASGLRNGPTVDTLLAAYQAEQEATIQRIGDTPLSQLPSLAAWRSVFRGFGVDPTQYRCAAEALLRRLTKKGAIPSINTLVDVGNLVSIRYALPVAIFDTRAIHGAVTVRFSNGSEQFITLGEGAADHLPPSEAIFADEANLVIARRWCWRQSDESAARDDTTDALITVEAHHENGHTDVAAAVDALLALLNTYASGACTAHVLDTDHPEV